MRRSPSRSGAFPSHLPCLLVVVLAVLCGSGSHSPLGVAAHRTETHTEAQRLIEWVHDEKPPTDPSLMSPEEAARLGLHDAAADLPVRPTYIDEAPLPAPPVLLQASMATGLLTADELQQAQQTGAADVAAARVALRDGVRKTTRVGETAPWRIDPDKASQRLDVARKQLLGEVVSQSLSPQSVDDNASKMQQQLIAQTNEVSKCISVFFNDTTPAVKERSYFPRKFGREPRFRFYCQQAPPDPVVDLSARMDGQGKTTTVSMLVDRMEKERLASTAALAPKDAERLRKLVEKRGAQLKKALGKALGRAKELDSRGVGNQADTEHDDIGGSFMSTSGKLGGDAASLIKELQKKQEALDEKAVIAKKLAELQNGAPRPLYMASYNIDDQYLPEWVAFKITKPLWETTVIPGNSFSLCAKAGFNKFFRVTHDQIDTPDHTFLNNFNRQLIAVGVSKWAQYQKGQLCLPTNFLTCQTRHGTYGMVNVVPVNRYMYQFNWAYADHAIRKYVSLPVEAEDLRKQNIEDLISSNRVRPLYAVAGIHFSEPKFKHFEWVYDGLDINDQVNVNRASIPDGLWQAVLDPSRLRTQPEVAAIGWYCNNKPDAVFPPETPNMYVNGPKLCKVMSLEELELLTGIAPFPSLPKIAKVAKPVPSLWHLSAVF